MVSSDIDTRNTRDGATEETPLLVNSTTTPTADQDIAPATVANSENAEDKPLPKLQILLLCYARLVEPIAFFSIFPFINQMVQENGNLSEADVGFYSGLIESLFSLTQMLVMIFWGRMSDRMGRKPVLVISLFGVGITTTLFGFGRTIWQMILYRCLAGVFAGSIVTIRTMISELSTKRTQARAFSFFAFAGNLGIFLGPLIGGALADPAYQYGGIFSRVALFTRFPYALPTIGTGIIGTSAAITTLLFVEETKAPASMLNLLPQPAVDDSNNHQNGDSTAPQDNMTPSQPKSQPTTTRELLNYPGILPVLYIYGHTMLLAFSYTAIITLFWFTSPEKGGFGFSLFQISIFMGLVGLSQSIWLLVVFPPLHKRIGTKGVMKVCGIAYPIVFATNPLLNLLLRSNINNDNVHASAATRVIFWILAPTTLAIGVGVSMAFTACQLAVNDISPSPETLGTLNALALTLVSGIRAVTPWLFTTLFAVGARTQIMHGYLIWFVLVLLAAALMVALRWLPEKAAGNGMGK